MFGLDIQERQGRRFNDSLLQERPTMWRGIGPVKSTALFIGWAQPPKPFQVIAYSDVNKANCDNIVDPDDDKRIDTEL